MWVGFRTARRATARARRGLTLVEVIVALVVLGIAGAVVGIALLPRPREEAELAELVQLSRTIAVRRAETMRLAIAPSGAWTLAGTAGQSEIVRSGALQVPLPRTVVALFSPFGTCALDARTELAAQAPRLDALTCSLLTSPGRPAAGTRRG